jgi:TetR/AcrR family transcriptional regulator
MTNTTEQEIINSSLKVFSERGYLGATTVLIAEKSGYSEKTLFRRFKSKKNLFNTTILQKGMEMGKFFEESVLVKKNFKNPRDFLETLIRNYRKLGDHYFEFFHLAISERTRIHEPIMEEFNFKLSEYIKANIPDKEIDYMTFGLIISSFMYMTITEYNLGRQAIDLDTVLEKFIDILLFAIQ